MKKVLSVVLALSMLISAFALTSVASADAVDVTIFQPTFGGRKGFSTETWGQAMNIEVNGKLTTVNVNGAATAEGAIEGIEGALVSVDDNGNIVISSYDKACGLIQTQLWADASKANRELWDEALVAIETANGSLSTDGLSIQYTVTNNGACVALFKPDIYVPMIGEDGSVVAAKNPGVVEATEDGALKNEYGVNEYIFPGETVTFEYALPAGSTFADSNADPADITTGVSVDLRAVNASSFNAGGMDLELVISPIKVVNTTDKAITEPAAQVKDIQPDAERPARPYREVAVVSDGVFCDWTGSFNFFKSVGWRGFDVNLDDMKSAMTVDENGMTVDTTGLTFNSQMIQMEMVMDKEKAAAAIEEAKAGEGKLYFKVKGIAAKAGKFEDLDGDGEKEENFYDTKVKVNKVYCFADGNWQEAVNLAAEVVADGDTLFTIDVADLGDMVPDTIAMNISGEWYDDGLTYANFTVTPITVEKQEVEIVETPSDIPTTTETPSDIPTTTEPTTGLIGDVNCDGKISVTDVRKLASAIASANIDALGEQGVANADVSGDGRITVTDVRKLASAIASGK